MALVELEQRDGERRRPAPEPADAELVRAAQGGDRAAFAALVKRYQNTVCAIAFALTGRFNLSEDVAQESFILAWQRLRDLREPERFRSWLLMVAKRAALRALRNQRSPPGETGLANVAYQVASSEPSPLDSAISREEEAFLWRALRRVPETYRVPLVLFYRSSNSTSEVARALDMSEHNARQRLVRGRRMLQQHMIELLEAALGRTRPGEKLTTRVAAALVLATTGSAGATAARAPWRWSGARLGAGKPLLASVAGIALTLTLAGLHYGGRARSSGPRVATPSAPASGAASPRMAALALRSPRDLPENSLAGTRPGAPFTTAPRPESTVLEYDFEDGILPETFLLGHVAPGPPRAGNQHALMATILPYTREPLSSVFFRMKDVHFRDSLVLRFDYWLGNDGGDKIEIVARNIDKSCNYDLNQKGAVHGRWARAAFPLSNLLPRSLCPGGIEAGDTIVKIEIYGGRAGGTPFFVDNLRLVDAGGDESASLGAEKD